MYLVKPLKQQAQPRPNTNALEVRRAFLNQVRTARERSNELLRRRLRTAA